jgi:hypothetical protein
MKTVMFNPYTGTPRHPSDIASDPSGLLILEPGAPLRAAAQVVALEPEGPDGHGVNWLAGKRPKPGDLLFGGDAVARALAAKNEAETRELKAAQHLDEVLAVLRELVSLVDMKTRLESLHEMGHGTDWDDWRRRNQEAWAAARIAVLGA